MGTLGGGCRSALAEPRWGKPSSSVRFPSPPHRGSQPVGGRAPSGHFRSTLFPALLIFLPRRSTFAGKCPGWVGQEEQSGRPGGGNRFLCSPVEVRSSPLAHIPTPQPPTCPISCPSFGVFRRRIPASYRSINDAFTEYLLSTCQFGAQGSSSWEVDLPATDGRPALQHSISSPPDARPPSGLTCRISLLPKKNLSSHPPHHSDTT